MRHRLTSLRLLLRSGSSLGLALGTFACSHPSDGPGASHAGPASDVPTAASDGTPPSAAARQGQASVFVVHMVSDYDGFRRYFETGAAERAKAGVKGYLLSKLDDGRVVIHFFADDVETVTRALHSPELQKYVDAQGAPDSSLVWLARDVVVRLPATPPTGETYSLYLKTKTADFDAFRRGFEARHAFFGAQGVVAEGLHRGADQDDVAIVHLMGTSREKLEALVKQKEFSELLALTKSPAEAKPLIAVDVARSRPE